MCNLQGIDAEMLLTSLLKVLLGQHCTRLLSTITGVADASYACHILMEAAAHGQCARGLRKMKPVLHSRQPGC